MPRTFRLHRSAELRRTADALLTVATHEDVRAFIQRAIGDLDDAGDWLAVPGIEGRPAVLTIIDMDLALAEYRLRAASVALSMYGPDADTIG